MSNKKLILLSLLLTVVVALGVWGLNDGDNRSVHKKASEVLLAGIQVREQVVVVQEAVERWAKVNADHRYPASVDDLNDAGKTMVDLLPEHHRLLNAYHKCRYIKSAGHQLDCFIEPRNWESDSIRMIIDDGAIYYCPKTYGEGYFIRAYNKAGEQPLALTNQ